MYRMRETWEKLFVWMDRRDWKGGRVSLVIRDGDVAEMLGLGGRGGGGGGAGCGKRDRGRR